MAQQVFMSQFVVLNMVKVTIQLEEKSPTGCVLEVAEHILIYHDVHHSDGLNKGVADLYNYGMTSDLVALKYYTCPLVMHAHVHARYL